MQDEPAIDPIADDVRAIAQIDAVQTILEVVCRSTGLRFSAVARVTDDRWVACAVKDGIALGLEPGGELKVETTICDEIRRTGERVVIDHVAEDERFRRHQTPALYGFQSYISVPIVLKDGRFFGTLCALDPAPARVNTPDTVNMFTLFADLIAFHLESRARMTVLEDQVRQRTRALEAANEELRLRIRAGERDRDTLRALGAQLERVREHERATLARELHDEYGQALTALKLDLHSTKRALDDRSAGTAHPQMLLARMEAVVDAALDGVDRIVSQLRPALLDRLGFAAAAEWLVSQFASQTELRTSFESDPSLKVDDERGTALFRIVQEALTNVARHAQATAVQVQVAREADAIVVRVIDDGCGIREEARMDSSAFGLKGMDERARALGGDVTVRTRPAGGTEVVARIPARSGAVQPRASTD